MHCVSRLCLAAGAALVFGAVPAAAETFLSRTFTLQETGWYANIEVHRPRDTFGKYNRDITLMSFSVVRSWEFRYGIEAAADLGIFVAQGTHNEIGWPEPVNSDAYGVNLGGGLRWYAFDLYGVRPFADGFVNFVYTPGNPFPSGGSGVNGYLRAGGGVRVDLSPQYAIEGGYHLSHVSNGGGVVPGNPAYNGAGFFLNIRFRG